MNSSKHMEVTTSYSAKLVHPATLAPNTKAMVFKFNTGHQMIRYAGGAETFLRANGRALNQKCGALLVAQMRAAAEVTP